MAKAKAKVTTRIKKKSWHPIIAPKAFNNAQLGEIYLVEANKAVGRVFWHPLKELTNNMRDQSVYLNFKIKRSPDNKLITDIIGYKMTPTSIKKMVRRNNDRSDDSFVVLTSDNKKIRIKTLILTAHKTKNSISTLLKKAMIKKLTEEIKKINFGNLLDKLISYRLQIETKKFLTKIYPVKVFAVKSMGLEKEKLHEQEAEEDVVEEVKEEVKTETKEKPKTEEKKPETPKKEEPQEKEEKETKKVEEKIVEKKEKIEEKSKEDIPIKI